MVAISDTDKSGGPLLRMGKLTTYALYIVPAHPGELSSAEMGDCNHLVLAKFKEGVVVEDLLKGMEKLASEMDTVKSFQWYFFPLVSFDLGRSSVGSQHRLMLNHRPTSTKGTLIECRRNFRHSSMYVLIYAYVYTCMYV
ncbi:uncharacterized protein LOC131235345 isoform X2 [Magnolia sinica]|uniref:uncharacterized protein LOC131235345 isoform X2 n=1 Tax=Magnolia sinica TaxID=86752 RepID=UPI00265ABE17|nr:uncharacterized protein LOC131235345 isoform X2 [Magnolia sinica]